MAGDKGFGGIAKKWLKAQADELLTADKHKRENADIEGRRLEREAKERATEEAVYTAVPGLRDFKERSEAAEVQRRSDREAKRIAELAARPQAGVGLSLSGGLVGSWAGQLPAAVEIRNGHLYVDLTPLDDQRPLVSGLAFEGWQFVIPRWHGAGTYDLAAAVRALEAASETYDWDADPDGERAPHVPDSFDWSFRLDGSVEEPYYWHPDAGAGTVEALGDGRQLKVHMAMDSAGGSIVVVAEVNLPELG